MKAVWAVTDIFHCEQTGESGTELIAIYATEQTARQHADRDGYRVQRMIPRTTLREY